VAVEQGEEHLSVIARDVAEPFEDMIAFEQADIHRKRVRSPAFRRNLSQYAHGRKQSLSGCAAAAAFEMNEGKQKRQKGQKEQKKNFCLFLPFLPFLLPRKLSIFVTAHSYKDRFRLKAGLRTIGLISGGKISGG
jgi:hypothetical protein